MKKYVSKWKSWSYCCQYDRLCGRYLEDKDGVTQPYHLLAVIVIEGEGCELSEEGVENAFIYGVTG